MAFLAWLRKRGVEISPKIDIHDYRDAQQGRGIIALEDIQEDEALFTIPRGAVMSVDADTADFYFKVPEIKQLDPWMSLILYMIYQSGSPDSDFKPYFDVLPKQFSTLMYWDEGQAENLLVGSTLVKKIGKEEAEESFREHLLPIIEAHKDIFEGIDASVNAFHRMGSLVMSYSFDVNKYKLPAEDTTMEMEEAPVNTEELEASNEMSLDDVELPHELAENDSDEHSDDDTHNHDHDDEDESDDEDDDFPVKAMVPLADTLNAHSKLCNAHLCEEDDMLVMRSTSKIPKGSQVYNTYGDFPNGDLLRRYGYVETGGTDSDLVEITIENIAQAMEKACAGAPKQEATMELVTQLSVWSDDILDIVDDSYDIPVSGIPENEIMILISFLIFATCRTKDYKAFKRNLRSASKEDSRKILKRFIKSLGKYAAMGWIFREAVPVWKAICETRLSEYPELVQKASELLDSDDNHSKDRVVLSREGMATEVLTGEARILRKCLQWVGEAHTIPVEDLELQQKESSKRKIGYGPKATLETKNKKSKNMAGSKKQFKRT